MSLELLTADVPLEPTSQAQEMLPLLASVSHFPGEGGAVYSENALFGLRTHVWRLPLSFCGYSRSVDGRSFL